MDNLADNYVIKFLNLSKKKESLFANFRVKGLRGGVTISSTISVDISALELHPGDSLEKIVEQSAHQAIKEFKRADFHIDIPTIFGGRDLGVAQLG